jgi:hypothetical protein
MRVPQVSERIKEAPAQALRGVFAGIGQLLLITDKLRNKTPAGQQVPRARAPEPSETHAEPASPPVASVPADPPVSAAPPTPAAPAAPAVPVAPTSERVPEARDFDKTGNVRLLPSAEAAAGGTAPTAGAAASVAEATAAEATAAEVPVAEPGAPLPNYDELSIASLRARLRNLDVTQLRQLVKYESAHAGRADVITMFERRIAKLEAETTPEERGEAAAEAEAEARDAVEAEVKEDVDAEAEGEA